MRLDRIDVAISDHPRRGGRATSSDDRLRAVASDLAACEEFLRARLTRSPGISRVQGSFAVERVAYRTNLPLGRRH